MKADDFWAERVAFLAYIRSKGLSRTTIESYEQEIKQFYSWFVGERGGEAQITGRGIRDYLACRFDRGNAPGTIRATITALRAFFRFLVLDEIITEDQNPMRLVEHPRMRLPEIHPLEPQEISRLLDTFDEESPFDHRNYVVCLLILDTGLRVGEITRLRLEDICFDSGSIKVLGKGRKMRTVYMGEKMRALLQDYIQDGRHYLADGHSTLFPPAPWCPSATMAPHSLCEIIRKKMDAAAIPRCHSSAHRLRHTFAKSYLVNGGDVFTLQQILGHSNLNMTRRYVRFADQDVREAHRRASPVDRMEI